jgi:hypothetical protein
MQTPADDHVLGLVSQIVAKHGCKIVEIDLENHILNIEGPEDKQVECALEIEKILG